MDLGRKWLADFNVGKPKLILFDRSNNTGATVKMDGSVLEEKSFFKTLGLTFSSELDWGFYIISIAKTATKKMGGLVCSMKFLFPEVCSVSLKIYHTTMHGILLPCLGWCS